MLTHLSASTTAEAIAEAVAADGAVIVDRLAPSELLDDFFAEMRPWIDATAPGTDEFAGRNTFRTGALLARSQSSQRLVTHPLILDSVSKVLAHGTGYQLHLTQVIGVGPGNSAQQIHRDQWAFDFFPFPTGYDVQCNTIWAGDDFTEANGATRVVPGSHLMADGLSFEGSDTIPAEMERGSVLIYNGAVYHGGGENRTDSIRRGINITYNLSFLRQEENQYLSVPIEMARSFPEPLQRLMGYQRGAYALGYIDDLRDPIEALRDGSGEVGLQV